MTAQDFAFVSKLLLERSAIVLEPGKEYLVEARLTPMVRKLELASITELVERLRAPGSNGLLVQIVEALVTTETLFFRDAHPFEALKKTVLPDLIGRRANERALTIWCAASSTGQEPYSVAMLLREHFPQLRDWNVRLLATDLSRDVLGRARAGTYSQIEVNRGLPARLLVKYFQQEGAQWQLKQEIRDLVEFREMNLAQPWPILPRMDLILNRNVMIYFDVETKKSILSRIAQLLRPDGWLLLGGSETTFNLHESFERAEPVKSGFYRLAGAPKPALAG